MRVAISDAKAQLTSLIRRAEAGEDVVFTRHGREVARLTPLQAPVVPLARRALMEQVRALAAAKLSRGASAARSQDFLYDDDGLPR